jgi:hypothetical protein
VEIQQYPLGVEGLVGSGDMDRRAVRPDRLDAGAQRSRQRIGRGGIMLFRDRLERHPSVVIVRERHHMAGVMRHTILADLARQCGTRLLTDRRGNGDPSGGDGDAAPLVMFIHNDLTNYRSATDCRSGQSIEPPATPKAEMLRYTPALPRRRGRAARGRPCSVCDLPRSALSGETIG